MPEDWRKTEKLAFLREKANLVNIEWQELHPDARYTWFTETLSSEFMTFLPIGSREAKAARDSQVEGLTTTIFKLYSRGAETTRDSWMYDFDSKKLAVKVQAMIEVYNAELSRWIRAGSPKEIDSFVTSDEKKIKWSSRLKEYFVRKKEAAFNQIAIHNALYRPFCKQFLYFDPMMTHRQGLFPNIFPIPGSEQENTVICLTDLAAEKPFMAIATNIIPDLHVVGGGANAQCFSYYTYTEDGSNRRENIADWVLAQFQVKFGSSVKKWDVFHYVYAVLHHPEYRERYAENLKHDLPHIPLLHNAETFQCCTRIGKQLMESHLHYDEAKEYPLQWVENQDVPFTWCVEKMRLTPDRNALVVNQSLTLSGIPPECFGYRLGNRSALEWVIDQYQVSEHQRSRIVSDPNNPDDEEYIVRLVGKVITVSMETVRLVNELAQEVRQEDWMSETSNVAKD